ncbi:MAG: hypothetical protein H6700_01075 [Myxococcales bacterium]|nr:hypothetical protein [Myxococcales bacterium]
MNAGTFGTSADFVARVIPTWIQPLSPDVVVYYPFAGNDLVDLTGDGSASAPVRSRVRPTAASGSFRRVQTNGFLSHCA